MTGALCDRLDRGCLLAFGASLDLELDLLVLLEGLEARTLDLGEVGEEILAAAVGLDEAEALRVGKPFDGSRAHLLFPLPICPDPPGGGQRLKEHIRELKDRRRMASVLELRLKAP